MNYTIVNSDSYYFYVKLMAKPGPAAGKILKIDYGKPCLLPDETRYNGSMKYRRCGRSGIQLPKYRWIVHNFEASMILTKQANLHRAFDKGITHFDLANNYGPPYGSAEETFGKVMKQSFMPYRNELFISTRPVTICGPDYTANGAHASI